jgi:hypothetical protein
MNKRKTAPVALLGHNGGPPIRDPAPVQQAWRINVWRLEVGGISRGTVHNLISAGRIEAVKLGSATLVRTPPSAFLGGLPAAAAPAQPPAAAAEPAPVRRGRRGPLPGHGGRPRLVPAQIAARSGE